MHYNKGRPVDIIPLTPQGTNSTMFTACCEIAICDYERCCSKCGREVVGANELNNHERRKSRWQNATRHWKSRLWEE